MKTWTRAQVETICGGPRHDCRMMPGEPMLVLHLASLNQTFVRCAHCAGEPVPSDLPAHVETVTARPQRVESMSRLGLLPMDREPGEEG